MWLAFKNPMDLPRIEGEVMAEDDAPPPKKVKFHSLPATEGLIFDIVKYLLEGNGASSSREIVEYISFGLGKSRRHTAPEIVGVLRNRKMFCPTTGYQKHSGNRWRLDLSELARYLKAKNYEDRADALGLDTLTQRLKRRNISATITSINELIESDDGLEDDELINQVYDSLLYLWG